MFVQVTSSRRKGGKTYLSYLVRQSFRTAAGPRSRTVCNITDLPAQNVQLHQALDYGGLAVLNDSWRRFGVDRFLAAMGSPRQRGLLQAMIYARLLFPCA